MNESTFESLVSSLFDGDISEEDFHRLEEYLEGSPKAQRLYLDFVDIHNLLDLESVHQETAEQEILTLNVAPPRRFNPLWTSLAAAAVLMLFGGLAFYFVSVREPEPVLSFRVAPDSLYEVIHLDTGSEGPPKNTLAIGSQLRLTQGTIELNLASGVVSIVQAPADLILKEENRLQINQGIGWFRVEDSGKGFEVLTPRSKITDFGTEFGVLVLPDQPEEVHLFQGQIEVEPRAEKESFLVHRLVGREARILTEGGGFEKIAVRRSPFLTSLPNELPHVHLGFDSVSENQFEVESRIPRAAVVHAKLMDGLSSARLVDGVRGRALQLRGDGEHVATDWMGIGGDRPRTLAFWIQVPKNSQVPVNSLGGIVVWGTLVDNQNTKFKASITGKESSPDVVARMSFGSQWFNGSTPLNDGEWHHLAFVYYGITLENQLPKIDLYVDGKAEDLIHREGNPNKSVKPIETDIENGSPLLIGKSLVKNASSFVGTIDELYIYNGALSSSSVQELVAEATGSKREQTKNKKNQDE